VTNTDHRPEPVLAGGRQCRWARSPSSRPSSPGQTPPPPPPSSGYTSSLRRWWSPPWRGASAPI